MRTHRSWAPALLIVVTAGLGGLAGAAEPAPADATKTADATKAADATKSAAATKVVGPPQVAWKDMSGEQKARYMKAAVTPKMRTLFQQFDGDTFKKFGCATCHGKDAKDKKFKMPNPEIAQLPGTPAGFEAAMKEKPTWPKWAKFMGEQVAPQMAALLGLPHFDPKKPDPAAFGCQGCHTIKKS